MGNFFEDIPGFSNFDALFNHEYHMPPKDWWIVITDVKGSTKAIEEGRYKDVNTVGVASIVAIKNAMGTELFPFVFGGDGATALIPDHKKEAVSRELSALKRLSKETFLLGLRVGMIRIQDVLLHDVSVEVAKYLLPSNTPIALFRGGGLTKAEELIKGEQEKYEIPVQEDSETDLRSLSCRWEPIPSQKGKYLSLLVCAQNNDEPEDSYRVFLERLSDILGGSREESHPVQVEHMTYRSLGDSLRRDMRYQRSFWNRIGRILDTFGAVLLFRLGLSRLIPSIHEYPKTLATHSDYQKFDDMLRMVLDCTPEELQAISSLCEEQHTDKKIFYGMHVSDTALMTCEFSGFENGSHLHFIDGGNGGYAMAAKQFKQQMKEAFPKA